MAKSKVYGTRAPAVYARTNVGHTNVKGRPTMRLHSPKFACTVDCLEMILNKHNGTNKNEYIASD